MKKNLTIIIILLFASTITFLVGRSFRPGKIPHGFKNNCATCHINPNGGGARNSFGLDVQSRVTPNGQQNFWDSELAALDSDGDGFSNGIELQDPNGEWIPGTDNPGDASLVTNPGDASDFPAITSIDEFAKAPNKFELKSNYPNPFNPTTNITFSIPKNSHVRLDIFNSLGQLVRTLIDQNYDTGNYTTIWNARNDFGNKVNSGVYIYRLVSKNYVDSKRMVLMK
jgi:Secretion system C-terminal sorting domain